MQISGIFLFFIFFGVLIRNVRALDARRTYMRPVCAAVLI